MNINSNTSTLYVLVTRRCQFNCKYCQMRRTDKSISEKDLFRAIDLLFTSKHKSLELHFFGGEPMLRFDLIKKGVKYSNKLARAGKKRIKYIIATNGFLMNDNIAEFIKKSHMTIMFSIDGDSNTNNYNRKLLGIKTRYYEKIIKNINIADKAGCDYFFNLVVTPDKVSQIYTNFLKLKDAGFDNFQFAYALGILWNKAEQEEFVLNLKKIKQYIKKFNNKSSRRLRLLNSFEIEPVFAWPTIMIDVNTDVYVGCSLVLEKILPNLQKVFYHGKLMQIKDINDLAFNTLEQMLKMLKKNQVSDSAELEIIKNNLGFGINIRQKFAKHIQNTKQVNKDIFIQAFNILTAKGKTDKEKKLVVDNLLMDAKYDKNTSIVNRYLSTNGRQISHKYYYENKSKEIIENDYLLKNIDFVTQNENISSLMLMMTYSCQLDCSYCGIKQKKSRIQKRVYKKAVKIMLNSRENDLLIRFWGGEPLLYSDLMFEIIKYCDGLTKKTKDKNIRFSLTTNGLNLNKKIIDKIKRHDMQIMLSLDGDECTTYENRISKKGHKDYFKSVLENLSYIQDNNILCFINMNICPGNVKKAFNNYKYLADKKVKNIQVVYKTGVIWQKEDILELMTQFDKINEFSIRNNINFMNIENNCEPVMPGNENLIDIDGKIYYDIAIFHEKCFPKLRKNLLLSTVDKIHNLQDLFYTKKDLFNKVVSIYPSNTTEGKIINNNMRVGLVLKEFIDNRLKDASTITENKKISNLLKKGISDQLNYLKKYNLGVDSYILQVSNECLNNCIFCKNKNVPITSLENIEYKLKENKQKKLNKICIVGNEPLNHPRIFEIIKICRHYGFKEFELMSSGMFLKDSELVRELVDMGLSSVSMPMYSIDECAHDKIVQRKGDYNDIMKAVDNLKKNKVKIYIHTNLLKQNIDEIDEMEKFIKSKITQYFCVFPIRSKLSNMRFRNLVPKYCDIARKVKNGSLVGFPLCAIGNLKGEQIDASKISDSMKIYFLDQNFIKFKKCNKCLFKKSCVGTFGEYVKIYGTEEICPIN